MATKLRFNYNGFRRLRIHPSVQLDIQRRLERIARAAGPGFYPELTVAPRNRARGAVVAGTQAARRKNARDNTLLRNLDAGR